MKLKRKYLVVEVTKHGVYVYANDNSRNKTFTLENMDCDCWVGDQPIKIKIPLKDFIDE